MLAPSCTLRGLEGYAKSVAFRNSNNYDRREQRQQSRIQAAKVETVVVLRVRDEVFASIAQLHTV